MAKNNPPSKDDQLAALVARKIAAGLSQADSIEVAERQIKRDAAAAARAAALSAPAE